MKLIICENPFQPSVDRTELNITPTEEALALALAEHGVDRKRSVLTLNGEILPPERGLQVTGPNDSLVVMPRLENTTLRLIAQIGIMAAAIAFSGPLGSFIAGSVFTSLTSAQGIALAGSLISVGGNLLVTGIASLFQKKPTGASLTWTGPQTTARSGIPIGKGFGTLRNAGNVIASWIDLQNADVDEHDTDNGEGDIGRMWMNVLVCFGFGPAVSLTDIRINDKDITNFADVAYFIKLGTNDQTVQTESDPSWTILNQTTTGTAPNTTPFTSFDLFCNNYPIAQRVLCGVAKNYVIVTGQRNDTDQIQVTVQFPQGVWRYDDNMVIKRLAIYYDVYYGDASTDTWILAQSHAYVNIRQTLLRQRTTITPGTRGMYDIKVVKNGSGAVDNPMDAFEHSSNLFGDEIWIESVQETCFDALSYPNMILLGLRVMATDQLSGSNLQVSALVDFAPRLAAPAELASYPANNPARVAYEIHCDPLVGGGSTTGNIDVDALAEWAELCATQVDNGEGGTQNLADFNGIFEQDGKTVWDAFQTVCAMSRATPIQIGTKVSVALDQPEDPVQMFHVGNILKDSYSKKYLNIADRAQEIEVEYADASDDYKTRTPLRVVTQDDQGSPEILKRTRVSLLGCTDTVQAFYWAYHRLLENKLKLRMHTWDSPAQAIVSRIGNVAWLQHDVPGWANGGLMLGGTASAVNLDNSSLPWNTADTFTLTAIHPALLRFTGTVSAISGNIIGVTGFTGSARVMRLVDGSTDVAIDKYSSGQVTVEDPTGINVGDTVQLWDTDVIEQQTVSNYAAGVATLSAPLSAAPTEFAGYIYQSTSKKPIKVRIAGIKRTGDQKFTISATDYTPDVYTIPSPIGLRD